MHAEMACHDDDWAQHQTHDESARQRSVVESANRLHRVVEFCEKASKAEYPDLHADIQLLEREALGIGESETKKLWESLGYKR